MLKCRLASLHKFGDLYLDKSLGELQSKGIYSEGQGKVVFKHDHCWLSSSGVQSKGSEQEENKFYLLFADVMIVNLENQVKLITMQLATIRKFKQLIIANQYLPHIQTI